MAENAIEKKVIGFYKVQWHSRNSAIIVHVSCEVAKTVQFNNGTFCFTKWTD